MGLKGKLSAALGRHRGTIDEGITTIGEAADARTGGRHQDNIRKGVDHARDRLGRIDPEGPEGGQPARR